MQAGKAFGGVATRPKITGGGGGVIDKNALSEGAGLPRVELEGVIGGGDGGKMKGMGLLAGVELMEVAWE